MNKVFRTIIVLNILLLMLSCSATRSNENTVISLKTSLGDIKIKLYDGTPVHRDNFIKLVTSGFYEGVSFHRVIKNFMIQAGDPLTKTGSKTSFPDSIKTYTLPAEINGLYYHKKGALAAAREGNDVNPDMRSSGTQFYIVEGTILTDEELNQSEQRINGSMKQSLFYRLIKQTTDSVRMSGNSVSDGEIQEIASMKMFQFLTSNKDYKLSDEQRTTYKTIGGTPGLDNTYTVFGEVIEGLDVVEKIAAVPTDSYDKPLNDVKILKIKIINN